MQEEPELLNFARKDARTTTIETGGGQTFELRIDGGAGSNALSVPAWYSGVRFISETLSNLPKGIYRKNEGSRDSTDHYANELIAEFPNDLVIAPYLWETAISHAVQYGNGYILIERSKGKVVALYNLHALMVRPIRKNGRQYYQIRDGSTETDVNYLDVIHIRNWSNDGESGVCAIDQLCDMLSLPRRVDEYLNKYFENGAMSTVAVEADVKLDKAGVDTLRYGIEQNNVGIENAHKVMILSQAKVKTLSAPLKDFALDVIKASNVTDIARVLRIVPHAIYALDQSNYNSLEWLGTELVKFSFVPWVNKIELEIKRKLLTAEERAAGYYCKWNLEGLQRGDYKTRAEVGVSLYTNGLITKNHWRRQEELPDVEGGDEFLTPLNLGSTGGKGNPNDASKASTPTADAQPVQTAAAPTEAAPLNGAQITAAVEVVVQLRAGVLTAEAAEALLVAVGLPRADALGMVSSTVAAGPLQTVTATTPTPPTVEEAPKTGDAPSDAKDDEAAVESKPTSEDLKAQYGRFLNAAADRVRSKQVKAFASARKKDEATFGDWLKRFSDEQGVFLADALNPFLETVVEDAGELGIITQIVCEDFALEVANNQEQADPQAVIDKVIKRIENEEN